VAVTLFGTNTSQVSALCTAAAMSESLRWWSVEAAAQPPIVEVVAEDVVQEQRSHAGALILETVFAREPVREGDPRSAQPQAPMAQTRPDLPRRADLTHARTERDRQEIDRDSDRPGARRGGPRARCLPRRPRVGSRATQDQYRGQLVMLS
jgi:hypothetical protein